MTATLALLSSLLFLQADVDKLLERLRTEDAGERRRAQAELIRLGAEAVPAMLRTLESASPRPEEEVTRLVKRLESPRWKERSEATEALVRLGRAAIPVLEAKVAAADPEAAWRLKSAIAEIREKAGQDEQLEEYRAAALCDALGQAGDGRAVVPLLKLLEADAPEKRIPLKLRASQALGLLRATMSAGQAEEAADRILQQLERITSPLEKAMLFQTLGRLGAASAVRPLAALLSDRSEKNVHLKRSAMAALAAIGQARGVHAIVDALTADDVYVRQGAAALLQELAGDLFGFDPRATPDENQSAIEKFKSWGASKYGKDWNN
ncbi:MAG TPA: HEAT repeat domain-containing protein [Planctomycetota bacterium]|jgi:HEAT repeat protein|nr:HEAT repeat domain-containing protein [Planctomycetota bacterium]